MVRKGFPRLLYELPDVVNPEDHICFQIQVPNDKKHIAAFRGALWTLASALYWQDDEAHTAKEVAAVWREIWDNLESCDGELLNPCTEYSVKSGVVTYAPQDPFLQPGVIPEGYIAPAWFAINEANLLSAFTGAQIGDVVTGWFSLPVFTPAIGQGLARFRVHVYGAGTVELHLLQIPLGGAALITKDDNPLDLQFIELNQDDVQIPPENTNVIIQEVVFETDGAHHVDVTYLPRFNDEAVFVAYGGGLRKIVLCGFDKMSDGSMDGIEIEDCMRLRIHPDDPCIIQHECSPGEWENWYDPRACIASGVVVQPGAGGELPEFECNEYDVTLRASDRWLLPVPVEAGYTIQITNAQGGWNDSSLQWSCPDGRQYFLGICGTPQPGQGTDPRPDLNHMRLIAEIDGLFYDAYNTTINVPVGTASSELTFQANDGSLEGNGGSISFHVKVCNTGGVVVYEQLIVSVATGATVATSFNTDPSILYKLTLSGTGKDDTPADNNVDSFYPFNASGVPGTPPLQSCGCGSATHIGVLVDCHDFPVIPAYSTEHVYIVYLQGTGAPFELKFCDDSYGTNSGEITVIVEAT
jgi:hypothetical protein